MNFVPISIPGKPGDRSDGTDLPVALSYSLTVKVGQTSRPTQQSIFKNPYRAPLWIDEILFTVSNPDDSDYLLYGNSQPPSAALVGLRMKVNNRYLVEEFVPLWLLAPRLDVGEAVQDNVGTTVSPYQKSFMWKLAKPMWLDELDDLSYEINFSSAAMQFGFPQTSTATVTVTVKGRSTINSKRPKERAVPFAVVWNPDMFSCLPNAETQVVAPDNALRNGRPYPVVITRMLSDFMSPPPLVTSVARGSNSNMLLQARISHSLGYYFVKDLVPLYEMFLNLHREFGVRFVLQPKEFLTVELHTRALGEAALVYAYTDEGGAKSFTVPAVQYWGGFSLQGYSMEPQ